MARLLSVFSILSALSFTVAAPSPSKLHAITLGYRDIFELSTHQSKRAGQFTLPPLPFAYDALRPIIETEIMRIHHDKHHKNYVTNLNAALANQTAAIETKNIPTLVELQEKVRFNGGGHINHSLFWKSLAPYGSKATDITISAPSLRAAIEKQWGSLPSFMNDFNNTLMNIEGSGWGWLTTTQPEGKLSIISTKNQDPVTDAVPLFGVDMWEHAYYLQYQNNKASYASGIWKVINWQGRKHAIGMVWRI